VYDVVFDVAGSHRWSHVKRVLKPDGILVQAGAPTGGSLLGPLGHILATWLASIPGKRKVVFFIAKFNRADVAVLAELLAERQLTPYVERTFPLAEAAEALRVMGEGHARGKLVVTIP
jgi:NADPH:quinone reductase-like Zn-dependent oxidoreductase